MCKPSANQDFNTLFLFSLLFSLSTLFLCIFSAIFSYRSFSSFAARLSLIAWIFLYKPLQVNVPFQVVTLRAGKNLTCLSSSFSAFISPSIFFVSASCACFSTRFAYDVWPAVGRKAFRGWCHCFPFLRRPVFCAILASGALVGPDASNVGIMNAGVLGRVWDGIREAEMASFCSPSRQLFLSYRLARLHRRDVSERYSPSSSLRSIPA